MTKIRDYFFAMRPQLIMFSFLVFLGAVIAVDFDLTKINYTFFLLVLISFQSLYYGLYIMNDIIDYEHDKNSSRKQHRPIASGRLPRLNAFIFFLVLIAIAFSISSTISLVLVYFELFFLFYVLFYSTVLKRIPYIDTVAGAVTHTMRIVMGITLFGVFNHYYLAIFLMFLFTSTMLLKRMKEIHFKEKVKRPIHYYSESGIKWYWSIIIPIGIILALLSQGIERISIAGILAVYAICALLYATSSKMKAFFEKIAD